ncbi:uridine kinase [Saccharospirillum impatiens]|uniref:uridine kinase n=1 Tax=Saccharospirillum impatiens TaxID=169438 RepID=UPI0003F9651D|nr:uridine kinase [Saccharospirillum impatiens]
MASIPIYCNAIVDHIDRATRTDRRTLVAIAGPPGSGKSTLADAVVQALNLRAANPDHAALLPMDGFHLDNELLIQQRLLQRKGAPETFDVGGLYELVVAARTDVGDIHYPLFDRSLDRSLVDAGLLKSTTSIVVFEGNYLLLDAPIWDGLTDLFDATVFLTPSLETLEKRLTDRWLGFGYSSEQAQRKVQDNDLKNARLVLENSISAGLDLGEHT